MAEQTRGVSQAELDHMAGVGVVVSYRYGDEITTAILDEGSLESGLWQDAAFTNGAPLQQITLEYAPDETPAPPIPQQNSPNSRP